MFYRTFCAASFVSVLSSSSWRVFRAEIAACQVPNGRPNWGTGRQEIFG